LSGLAPVNLARLCGLELRQQPSDLPMGRSDDARNLGLGDFAKEGAQGLDERAVREAAIAQLEAGSLEHRGALEARTPAELRDEARLPHAGLPADDDHRGVAGLRLRELRRETGQLDGSPDERRTGDIDHSRPIIRGTLEVLAVPALRRRPPERAVRGASSGPGTGAFGAQPASFGASSRSPDRGTPGRP